MEAIPWVKCSLPIDGLTVLLCYIPEYQAEPIFSTARWDSSDLTWCIKDSECESNIAHGRHILGFTSLPLVPENLK